MIKAGDKTYRRVSHQMGGWKWGYPRGQRNAIVRNEARPDAHGQLRWYSEREVCDGITAATEEYLSECFPEAFSSSVGSIHRQLVGETE